MLKKKTLHYCRSYSPDACNKIKHRNSNGYFDGSFKTARRSICEFGEKKKKKEKERKKNAARYHKKVRPNGRTEPRLTNVIVSSA